MMETRRLEDAMATMQTDIESLMQLVKKMEAQRDGAEMKADGESPRFGEQLLQSARDFLAVVKTGTATRQDHGVGEPDRSPLPSPTSSENVLVGVLKRENASLLAKIRRLENDAKRFDDKASWGAEHFERRLKNMEIQCADAIAEKVRLEKQCADVIAEKNRFEALYVEVEADKTRLEAQLSDAVAEKTLLKQQLSEVVAEKTRHEAQHAEEVTTLKNDLETQCLEAAAEKDRLEKLWQEAVVEKNSLKEQCVEAVAEKNRLEAQCVKAIAEKNGLEERFMEIVAEKDCLEKQCSDTVVEKTRLVKQCLEVAEEKNGLKAELAIERSRTGEMRTTIGQLTARLAKAENRLLEAKAHSVINTIESPFTRTKRSGTLETSGTDTDESDSPLLLSMLDLNTDNDDSDQSGQDEKKTRRSTMNVQVGEGASARRRSGVRRRSIISSMIDTDATATFDAARSCPRTRPRCQSDDAENQRTSSMRVERALQAPRSYPQIESRRSAAKREAIKSMSRYRAVELHSSQSSHSSHSSHSSQSSHPARPRWRL
jgi:hypothetical protein